MIEGLGRALLLIGGCLLVACGSSEGGGGASGGEGGDAGSAAASGETTSAGRPGNAGSSGNGGEPGTAGDGGARPSAGAAGANDAGDGGAPEGGFGGGAAGSGGNSGGSGRSSAGAGGTAGSNAGAGGSTAGMGNSAAGTGGSSAGAGGAPEPPIASVLTRSYDSQRTNANLLERTLTVANVNPAQFGKLFELPVDDEVYAQILYVPKLTIAGGTRDVIYVATVNNTVYAFDANTAGTPLWQRNFNGTGRPTLRSEVGQACGQYSDYSGNIGLVATPVIDLATSTMYVATRTVEGGSTLPRLHAIDIRTGLSLANSPKLITATVTNKANVAIALDAQIQNQRMSLALDRGAVYMGFSAFCDTGDYHGWMLAYDAATLAQIGVFNDTPDGELAGIWQAGSAPAFDPNGNLFVLTGNGTFDGITNFGESVLKLGSKTLGMLDFFTPANYAHLNDTDLDLGSAGPTWLAGPGLLVGGGKDGRLYLMNPANMGHFSATDSGVLQGFQAVDPTVRPGATHHIHNGVGAWQSPAGLNVYLAGENDYLRAFRFNAQTSKFDLPSVATATVLPPVGMPGGMVSISANGSTAGSGVVWSTTPRVGDANQAVTPGLLRAYDAQTLALLWESTSPLDNTLDFAKFSNPTIANGRVYAASFSRLISVYGLRTTPPVNLALNKAATGSAPCAANEGPEKAVNGSVIMGNADKWCSLAAAKFLQVDLGSSQSVNRVVLRHANAGGEAFAFNTNAFTVKVSTDNVAFTSIATVTDNIASVTTHAFPAQLVRYVRVDVTVPANGGNAAARIYELEAYAP